MAPRDLRALSSQICVVQILYLSRDGEGRLTSGHDLSSQESGTANDLLGWRPIEQRLEGCPIVIQFCLEALNLIIALNKVLELRHCSHVLASECGNLFA